MAKITRIKAKDSGKSPEKADEQKADKQKTDKQKSIEQKAVKQKSAKTTEKKPFILIRPLVYLGRYIRDSWAELRLVRWPTRKATWKLVLAIFIYTALFIAIIMLLDALFTWLFSIVIG